MRKKTRAVLLGTNAYPFLMAYWFKLFETFWQDEVDKVYIAISSPEHKSAWGYIKKLLTSNPKITVYETNTMWPGSINAVAQQITEDSIFIPHDDTFIYQPGLIDKYFKIVEETDKVVTPLTGNYSCGEAIEEIMLHRFPGQLPLVCENGEKGFSFYCNFFFISRELFHKTSMDFGGWLAKQGEECQLLNWTPLRSDWTADTNFKLGLELLREKAEFHIIPKYEFTSLYNLPNPLEEFEKMKSEKTSIFTENAGWVHLQTMAYHIYGLYFDYGEKEAIERGVGGLIEPKIHNLRPFIGQHPCTWSHTFRLAWIYEFMEQCNYGGMQRYFEHTRKELKYIEEFLQLDRENIDTCKKIFHSLIWK